MERYFDVVTDRRGNAISEATVTIKTEAGATATIYSDDGVTTTVNPMTTNADGEYTFFAANGKYTIQIVAAGYGSEVISDRVLYDPADAMAIREITTATYTLALADIGQWLDFNTSATATVSTSTAAAYALADSTIIRQKGAGQVVLAAGSGTQLETSDTAKTRVQKSVIGITRSSNASSGTAVFSVYGDMATS